MHQTSQDQASSDPSSRRPTLSSRSIVVAALIALVLAVTAGALVALSSDSTEEAGGAGDGELAIGELLPRSGGSSVGQRGTVSYSTFDGGTASTAEYLGKPLVLNFFAEWCPPCVAEMPEFEEVYQELGGQVAFLGLSLQESSDRALGIVELTGVTYDIGRDVTGEAFQAVGGTAMPTTVFIDAEGTIVELRSGALTGDQLRSIIEEKLL